MFTKKVIITSLFVLLPLFAFGNDSILKFRIISDIDDTVKVTHVSDPADAVKNGLLGKKYFSGMAELYSALSKNSGATTSPNQITKPLIFVSGSPDTLRRRTFNNLIDAHFSLFDLYLRNWFALQPIEEFKTEVFEEILQANNSPLVLIGDDTELDPQVFINFRKAHPEKVLALYIHSVEGVEVPNEIHSFSISFEIALNEFEQDRLNREQTLRIGEYLLFLNDWSQVFPDFVKCPQQPFISLGKKATQDETIVSLKDKLTSEINSFCRLQHQAIDQ